MKKSQVTIFLMIVMLIVMIFGSVMLFKQSKIRSGILPEVHTTESFTAAGESLEFFISECVRQTALDGVQMYGLSSGDAIAKYIEKNLDACTKKFQVFKSTGFFIVQGKIEAIVSIREQAVQVEVSYPITITKGGKTADYREFNFQLQTVTSNVFKNGIAENPAKIHAPDNKAVFILQEGTSLTNEEGDSRSTITLQLVDRHFNGLDNNVVIGTTGYLGLPEGVRFSPPAILEMDVSYKDIPPALSPDALHCAYWDKEAEIWRSYETLEVIPHPESTAFTVRCLVDHFSAIFIVDCGSEKEEDYTIKLAPFYKHPLEPADPAYWTENALEKGGSEDTGGIHLLPEAMHEEIEEGAGCNLTREAFALEQPIGHFYAGDEMGNPIDRAEGYGPSSNLCRLLLQDWDNDDHPEYDYKDEQFKAIVEITDTQGSTITPASLKSITKGLSLLSGKKVYYHDEKLNQENPFENEKVFSAFRNSCLAACRKKVLAQADRFKEFIPVKGNSQDYISGDGINDRTSLFCKVNVEKVFDQKFADACGSCKENCVLDTCTKGTYSFDCADIKEKDCNALATSYVIEDLSSTQEKNQGDCMVLEDNPEGEEVPFDNLKNPYPLHKEDTEISFTIEYPYISDREAWPGYKWAFYATPKTYGYAKTKPLHDAITLGGYAEYQFEVENRGNSCENIDYLNQGRSLILLSDEESGKDTTSADYKIGVLSNKDGADPVIQEPLETAGQTGVRLPWACSDRCTWTLNDDTMQAGRLKGGINTIRVYVENIQDPIMYANGWLHLRGKGLSKLDECGITVQERINQVLIGCDKRGVPASIQGQEWDPGKFWGREVNCLALYRNKFGAGKESLCNVDFRKIDGPLYCQDIAYTSSAENTKESAMVLSPHGGCAGTEMICPTILDASHEGCLCGAISYARDEFSEGLQDYCCKGELYDTKEAIFNAYKDDFAWESVEQVSLEHCRKGKNKLCWCKTGGSLRPASYTECTYFEDVPGAGWIKTKPKYCEMAPGCDDGYFMEHKCEGSDVLGCSWNGTDWDPGNTEWRIIEGETCEVGLMPVEKGFCKDISCNQVDFDGKAGVGKTDLDMISECWRHERSDDDCNMALYDLNSDGTINTIDISCVATKLSACGKGSSSKTPGRAVLTNPRNEKITGTSLSNIISDKGSKPHKCTKELAESTENRDKYVEGWCCVKLQRPAASLGKITYSWSTGLDYKTCTGLEKTKEGASASCKYVGGRCTDNDYFNPKQKVHSYSYREGAKDKEKRCPRDSPYCIIDCPDGYAWEGECTALNYGVCSMTNVAKKCMASAYYCVKRCGFRVAGIGFGQHCIKKGTDVVCGDNKAGGEAPATPGEPAESLPSPGSPDCPSGSSPEGKCDFI